MSLFEAFAEICMRGLVLGRWRGAVAAIWRWRDLQPFGKPALRERRSSWRCDHSGTSAIEFALVFPIFLTLFLAIVGYGTYIGAAHSVAQLAADAARASVAGLSDAERASIAKGVVATNASGYPLLVATKIFVSAAPVVSDASEFRVSVSYDAANLPIWGFAKFLPLPSQLVTSSATVKRGGY